MLASLEGGLRLVGYPDPGLYAGDIGSVWALRPGLAPREVPFPEEGGSFTVRTNAEGFRGGPYAGGGLACLGDSTTFGWGVEEEQAWPAVLAKLTGEPVLNAGVPGYSTFQGERLLPKVLALGPRRVILAYLVRDAQPAPVPDAARRPAPSLQLYRALAHLRARSGPQVRGIAPRVSVEAFAAAYRRMIARVRAAGAEPVVLVFPMRGPPAQWVEALRACRGQVPVIEPSLPAEGFFPNDRLHLNPAGHADLARAVAEAL
ncbi:MAG: GDSL-type esterase/lipase family protein [Pseudomonadota bacterium]